MNEQNQLGQFIPLHYHHNMLLDPVRMGGFKTAIGQVVQPGSVVVELGGGTGVLSFFAAQKAKKVYYVEYNPELVEEARRILAGNENGERVELVHGDACTFTPPEPVGAVICEMLHVGFLREKQLEVISAFKRNYAARHEGPLPIFIPFATLQAVQPVHHPFDFHGYKATVPMFNDPGVENPDITPLGNPAVYHQVVYDQPFDLGISWRGSVPITAAGTVNALRFITKNLLSVEPKTQGITDWHNHYLILPLATPIPVQPGDALEIAFAYESGAPLSALQPHVALA
ncbi:MAG: methyltransferase domain-containing protein [Defluviitaleaceae bacterium]|nr:methyltransferase domain-containing protein [Defluviitaleaceae bacterium]MCL2238624.1 methyltransferase domain-containing protein [Defluviitaleaceae bacterium]